MCLSRHGILQPGVRSRERHTYSEAIVRIWHMSGQILSLGRHTVTNLWTQCPELRSKALKTLAYLLRVALSRELVSTKSFKPLSDRLTYSAVPFLPGQYRLQSREKLPEYNTIDDAVSLIQQRKRILVLTGAGISTPYLSCHPVPVLTPAMTGVSCGIPDFRSRNGLYASLQESGEYDLDDPQQMYVILCINRTSSANTAIGSIYTTFAKIQLVRFSNF